MFLACCEQVRASSMLACSIPECSRRFCEHCLLTHLAEEVDPCSSSSWVVVGGKKQWHCPICRKKCCCSVTNCTATHRHCKAYRYRRRRAELASKRLTPGAASARGETPSLTLFSAALPDATAPGQGKEATEAAATNNAGVASGVASTKRPRKNPSTSRAKAKHIGYALLSSPFDGNPAAARGGEQREQSEAEAGGKLRGEQDGEEQDVLSLHDCAGDTDFMGQALTPRSRAAAGIDEARDMHQVIKRGAAREHPRAASHNKQQKRALSRGSGQLSGGTHFECTMSRSEPCHPMDWPDDRLDMGGYSE